MGKDPRELLHNISDIPPLPAIATRVMSLADSDRTSALELANVLSADQGLTAQLIKVSNSSYYGFARRVSTVRESVVLLGFKQVRQMAVGASIINKFTGRHAVADGFDLDLFWGHSVAVAIAAESIARTARTAKPEDAFTTGIIHDIGRLVLRQAMPEQFRLAMETATRDGTPLHLAEYEATGYSHDEVGQALGEQWKFPQHLVDAIARHHDETLTLNDGLAGVVSLSNRLALHYGLLSGYDADLGEPDPLPDELREAERFCGGIELVLQRAFGFIEAASGTPERWFATAS